MKIRVDYKQILFGHRSRGFAAMAMVAALGVTALLGLIFVFRRGVHSHDAQVRHQVKIDFKQKEDAFLRALIAEVPNAAIGAMMDDSWNNRAPYSWNRIIQRAIDLSNSEQAVISTRLGDLGLNGHIVANSGDYSIGNSGNLVRAITNDNYRMDRGDENNSNLFSDPEVGTRLPPPLRYRSGGAWRDRRFPIISKWKEYAQSVTGLGASIARRTGWPVYNIIDYPDIRFGLAAQDGKFVAKRNWWAFSVEYGRTLGVAADIPSVRKNYILSIYEVPSQSAISAVTQMRVGAGENGATWGSDISIGGGIFGTDVNVAGALNLLDSAALLSGGPGTSRISARNTIDLGNGLTTIGSGAAVENNFDALGQREARVASGQTFYRASVGGDSGRVAILPLGQDANFFRRRDYASGMSNALSRTTWDEYAWGARQCAMSIEIRAMSGTRPTAITFHYQTGSGMGERLLQEGDADWPNYNGNIGALESSPPFYVDTVLADGTTAFFINLEQLVDYVEDVLGGRPVEGRNDVRMNDSLCIWTNDAIAGLTKPGMISDNTTMAVVLANCADMSEYEDGFSLVTDHRVYFSGDFNQVPLAAGSLAGTGLLPGTQLFPAVSVFAPTIRYGTTAANDINLSGQITSLKTDAGEVNPLDLKESRNGASQTIAASRISADLSQIVSPAQLPPVNKMTWLVTVEEIHPN